MTALLLTALLAPLPPLPAAPEPPEVGLFAQWVEHQLISVSPSAVGFAARQNERTARLQDANFPELFSAVPKARALALEAAEAYRVGNGFQVAGLIAVGLSAGGLLVGLLLGGTVAFPIFVAALVVSGVALVLSFIALPFQLTAQSAFFSAIAEHNRGVLQLRPPAPAPLSGGTPLPGP